MTVEQTRQATPKGTQTASKVRAAAMRLFARHGYAAVSIRQIAQEVGVQPGALYNHFPTKQHILKDLMLAHMAELIASWEQQKLSTFCDGDPLDAFIRFHIRYHMEKGDEVFVSYMELRNLEPENYQLVGAQRRRYEAILTDILTLGANEGRYQIDDPKVATRAIIAMLTGIPSWYQPDGQLSPAEIEDLYAALVARLVAKHDNHNSTGERVS